MLNRTACFIGVLAIICWGQAWGQDSDGDGLSDAIEAQLGTDPRFPEHLQLVHEDGLESEASRQKPGYDPTKDLLTVEFCHVAGNRYLWRTTFAAPPRVEDMVHHLYLDADGNKGTGREGYGVEYMLSMAGGRTWSNHYSPDGRQESGPVVFLVADGNCLLTCADVELGRNEQGVAFRMHVLVHTNTPNPPMMDSTVQFAVTGIPLNDREKIMRPADFAEDYKVTGTYGLDIIRPMLTNPANVAIPYDQLELDGFEVDMQTERRYGHLRMLRVGAKASARVPRAGRFHPGFMMYDDGNPERIAIYVNDELAGVAVANRNNNRTWVWWLTEARELTTNDVITLEALGSGGKHGIAYLLLLAEPLPVRQIEYQVTDTEWTVPVGPPGRVNISWITSWPSASRFEYGPTTAYGMVAEEQCNRLVHRAHLSGLDPGVTYHGRGVGIAPDGTKYYGPDITFTAAGLQPPPTKPDITRVPLVVRNPHPVAAVNWPVTSGVPIPKGELASSDQLRVTAGGQEVLAQIKTLGNWQDGSVKWVLVTVLADVPAGGEQQYVLEYGRDVRRTLTGPPLARAQEQGVVIDTGALRVAVNEHGDLVLPDGSACATTLTAEGGQQFSTALGPAQITIEENGPNRAVIHTVGKLTAADGTGHFTVEQRIEAYRGCSFVRVQHTFVNDLAPEFTNIEAMSWQVPIAAGDWAASLAEGEPLALPEGGVRQLLDDTWFVGEQRTPGRLVGALVSQQPGAGAVAVRSFWHNYPKGFRATAQGVSVELAPDFAPGLYDQFPFEKEGHHLYYYLLEGHYRFKRGMAKTHELLLHLGEPARRAADCAIFQRPLLLTAPPQWYCDSNAFYAVAPRDEERFKAYEEAADRNFARYVQERERTRDYGMMNFGDWYPERGANWGNIEYDTQHAFFLQYIRSGDENAFFLGHDTEIHNRDIDTIQWSPDPRMVGAVYVHQMGHVGGYYKESVPGTLGIPTAGYSATHAWTEGHFDHYFLTGDPRSLATGMAVADFFADQELSRPYDWLSAREPGWHLILTLPALAATNDPYYLNVARVVVRRVLETQDTEPRELPEYQKEPGRTHQVGGWSRMLVPGHCTCEPRHRGNAGFMVAVLLSGLKYYHDYTGDEAVKQSIIMGARYLLDETYSEQVHGFRYTSCPNTRYSPGASPLMVEGVARAYLWTRDPRFLDVLTNGLAAGAGGAGYGKSFSMYYRCAPRVLADLAACGLTMEQAYTPPRVEFSPPEWLARLPADQRIIIQAEDFTAQGVGQVEIVSDRQATMGGKAITKWHQNEGHWLRWDFEVPQAGRYRIVLRYASGGEQPLRRLELDGAVPDPALERIAFTPTGGYGHEARHWQYRPLADAGGKELVFDLAAGRHSIKMTNLGDGMALDFIVLVREG